MKLLFDENISYKLVLHIQDIFPGSKHIKEFNLLRIEDHFIFDFAKSNSFDAIVTFDEDFRNMVLQKGFPPKVIWMRTGNLSSAELLNIIFEKKDEIIDFLSMGESDEYSCLEID